MLTGSTIGSATSIRVDTTLANVGVDQAFMSIGTGSLFRLFGNDVNHDTLPWYCYDAVVNLIS